MVEMMSPIKIAFTSGKVTLVFVWYVVSRVCCIRPKSKGMFAYCHTFPTEGKKHPCISIFNYCLPTLK